MDINLIIGAIVLGLITAVSQYFGVKWLKKAEDNKEKVKNFIIKLLLFVGSIVMPISELVYMYRNVKMDKDYVLLFTLLMSLSTINFFVWFFYTFINKVK